MDKLRLNISEKRTQVNFRIDEDFLQEIKNAARSQGIYYTEFIINACKQALGYEVNSQGFPISSLHQVVDRLNQMEELLEDYYQRLEKVEERLDVDTIHKTR